jgi:hypothetical protein
MAKNAAYNLDTRDLNSDKRSVCKIDKDNMYCIFYLFIYLCFLIDNPTLENGSGSDQDEEGIWEARTSRRTRSGSIRISKKEIQL